MPFEVVCSKCGPQSLENFIHSHCGWGSLHVSEPMENLPSTVQRIIDDINRAIQEAHREDVLPAAMLKLTEARQKMEEVGSLLESLLLERPRRLDQSKKI